MNCIHAVLRARAFVPEQDTRLHTLFTAHKKKLFFLYFSSLFASITTKLHSPWKSTHVNRSPLSIWLWAFHSDFLEIKLHISHDVVDVEYTYEYTTYKWNLFSFLHLDAVYFNYKFEQLLLAYVKQLNVRLDLKVFVYCFAHENQFEYLVNQIG